VRRFLEWWNRHQESEVFEDAYLFLDNDGQSKQEAGNLYSDSPFVNSGLRAVYSAGIRGLTKRPLWEGYKELSVKGFVKFAAALGVQARLEIVKTTIPRNHPCREELFEDYSGSTRWTGSAINEDYNIPSCYALLAAQDAEISRLIWRTMADAPTEVLQARCRPNRGFEPCRAPSSLVLALQDAEWIPDKSGVFRQPRDMTRSQLPSEFPFKGQAEWLTAVGFGEAERQRSESYRRRVEMAKELGLPVELLDRLDGLEPSSRLSAIEQFSDLLDRERQPEFPEHRSPNPERRAARLRDRLKNSPPRTRELKERTVRTSEPPVRADAKTYLRDFYTNADEVMVCQACHRPMPFRLPDGEYYFVAVGLFGDVEHEYRENYVAMCPVCAAMFRHASDVDPEAFLDSLRAASDLCVEVTMAGEDRRIRFVDDHRTDLLALAEVDSQEGTEADVAVNAAANS
jgi:hypothetical protein